MGLHITGDPEADRLLSEDPLALVIGMLLDQQVPMEWAFVGPYRLRERLGGHLDARGIAEMDEAELETVFRQKPSLHRFPESMARRTHALCAFLIERYGGDAAALWRTADSGAELLDRLRELPGYGDEKARILVALLAKRLGVAPAGWQEAAAPFGDDTPRSVADIDSPEALERVREWKRARKARGLGKAD
ncbi:MAG TPA: HhH-GPD-type base excision DNA repair protein [Nitriliruptorales bacterium]|nr:HhH-GPD-type base excision DNA repair protein [Nitriliruptorales bacterium]